MGMWSPLTTHWAVTTDSSPRTSQVDSTGHHHAASTSLQAVLQAMQPGGREVSANYVIYRDQIWGVVPEDRRAWTSASAADDSRAVTYEIINSSGGPDWMLDPVTVDTVMRLDADIASRYGIPLTHSIPGFWEHRNLWEWYRRSYPTACAGPAFNIDTIIAGSAEKLRPAPSVISESELTMNYLMIRDGEGRYGKPNGEHFATYDGRAFVKLSAADANAVAVANLAGRSFANVTYGAWEGYQRAAETVVDAT